MVARLAQHGLFPARMVTIASIEHQAYALARRLLSPPAPPMPPQILHPALLREPSLPVTPAQLH